MIWRRFYCFCPIYRQF